MTKEEKLQYYISKFEYNLESDTMKIVHQLILKEEALKEILELLKGYESIVKSSGNGKTDVQTIDYQVCSDAMLRMWMEDVLTDGEYNKVMGKLNMAHGEGRL